MSILCSWCVCEGGYLISKFVILILGQEAAARN